MKTIKYEMLNFAALIMIAYGMFYFAHSIVRAQMFWLTEMRNAPDKELVKIVTDTLEMLFGSISHSLHRIQFALGIVLVIKNYKTIKEFIF